MRRAAVPVPSNIAEGTAGNGAKELIHFLGIATGSLAELDTQLGLAVRSGYHPAQDSLPARLNEVSALTLALTKSLKEKL